MDVNWTDQLLVPVMRSRPMTNDEIYRRIEQRARQKHIELSPSWRATVRNTLQRHAIGHRKCVKPLFVHVDHGIWKARKR